MGAGGTFAARRLPQHPNPEVIGYMTQPLVKLRKALALAAELEGQAR